MTLWEVELGTVVDSHISLLLPQPNPAAPAPPEPTICVPLTSELCFYRLSNGARFAARSVGFCKFAPGTGRPLFGTYKGQLLELTGDLAGSRLVFDLGQPIKFPPLPVVQILPRESQEKLESAGQQDTIVISGMRGRLVCYKPYQRKVVWALDSFSVPLHPPLAVGSWLVVAHGRRLSRFRADDADPSSWLEVSLPNLSTAAPLALDSEKILVQTADRLLVFSLPTLSLLADWILSSGRLATQPTLVRLSKTEPTQPLPQEAPARLTTAVLVVSLDPLPAESSRIWLLSRRLQPLTASPYSFPREIFSPPVVLAGSFVFGSRDDQIYFGPPPPQ